MQLPTLPLLTIIAAAAGTRQVSAQGGWILGSYFSPATCQGGGGDQWYLADSVGGSWQCSDLYGKNPDGEFPPEGETMGSFYWSGAEDCGVGEGGSVCGNWVSELVLFGEGDEGCEEDIGTYTEPACEALPSGARYFMVRDL